MLLNIASLAARDSTLQLCQCEAKCVPEYHDLNGSITMCL